MSAALREAPVASVFETQQPDRADEIDFRLMRLKLNLFWPGDKSVTQKGVLDWFVPGRA